MVEEVPLSAEEPSSVEEPLSEEDPESLSELLPESALESPVEFESLFEPEVSVVDELLLEVVLLVLLFDVEVPGLSCSAPLLTQPVRVAAIAPTRREMKIFFIDYPFPVQTYLVDCLCFKQH